MTTPALPPLIVERVWALFLALVLGYGFVLSPIRQLWKDHWLVNDGREGIAVITKEHGHGVVAYQYQVGQKVYVGRDHRSLQNPKYARALPGEKTVVYFSASHPWLSAINLPHNVMIEGLPVVLLAWLIIAGLVLTAVNPRSRWAFSLGGQRGSSAAKEAGGSRDVLITATAKRGAIGGTQPSLRLDGWEFFKDKLRLLGCGVLVVLGMAVLEVAINAFFGRK